MKKANKVLPVKQLVIVVCVLLGAGIIAFVKNGRVGFPEKHRASRLSCINNLRQIGVSFKTWKIDYEGYYLFNLSTNEGGTLELCGQDEDGFDGNSMAHLRALSNDLNTPIILICPNDRLKTRAYFFGDLQESNVTYRTVQISMPAMFTLQKCWQCARLTDTSFIETEALQKRNDEFPWWKPEFYLWFPSV